MLTEAKNENISHILDLRSHVFIAKCSNGSEEIAGRRQNNSKYVSWVLVSNRKTLSSETFCFTEKCLLSIFNFSALSNLLLFCELLIGPQPTFLECVVIFL